MVLSTQVKAKIKIAVIGAGVAGVTAAKYSIEEGHDVDVFEQTGSVGGTWVFTEATDVDQNGVPVHSSMYKGLTTNIPKELMAYRDFPYPEEIKTSKIGQATVLEYIKSYVKHFNLEKYCKFYHKVILVTPLPDDKWKIKSINVKTKEETIHTYDAVFICNGHHKNYTIPSIKGLDTFSGNYIHSHVYRSNEKYKDKKVLMVGAGSSGLDITRLLTPVAKKVVLSHRSKEAMFVKLINYYSNFQKPEIEEIKRRTVVFKDGSEEDFDEIIFCTGYNYSFPFLSNDCNITVEENFVRPLYKLIINIEHPTMALIGTATKITPFPVFEVQVNFFLSHLKGNFHVSKKQMYQELKDHIKIKEELKLPKKFWQELSFKQGEYCEELAKMANIKPMKPVIGKLYKYHKEHILEFKNYKIINDEDFMII